MEALFHFHRFEINLIREEGCFPFGEGIYFSLRYGVREIGWFDKRAKFLWTEERVGIENRAKSTPEQKTDEVISDITQPMILSRAYVRTIGLVVSGLSAVFELGTPYDHSSQSRRLRLFQRKIQWKCIFRRVKKSSKFTVNSRFSAYSATFESFILKYNYIRTSKWLFRSVQLRWFVETLLRYQRHILSVLCRDQNREQHTGHPSFVRTRNEPATFTSELPRVV